MRRLRRQFVRMTDRFAGRGHAMAIQYRPASIEVTESGSCQFDIELVAIEG
jgi:hypothetical protein